MLTRQQKKTRSEINRRKRLRLENRCVKCRKESDGKQRCPQCRAAHRVNEVARYRKRGLTGCPMCADGIPATGKIMCAPCALYNRLSKFKFSSEEKAKVMKALNNQNKICGICKTKTPQQKGWHIDHDHTSNKFRGILCGRCNVLLGTALDSSEILSNALAYLSSSAPD